MCVCAKGVAGGAFVVALTRAGFGAVFVGAALMMIKPAGLKAI